MQDHGKRYGRLASWLTVLGLAVGAFPATAGAACAELPTSMVFAAWGDTSQYFLAKGGNFEGTSTTWTGGTLMEGNDPFYLAGGLQTKSLKILRTKTANSPTFCADDTHPDFRFVTRPLNASVPGTLDVFVRFVDRNNVTQTWLVATLSGIQYWTATQRIQLMRDLPLPTSGQTTASVQFRANGGDWAIDDVFIDPYRK